MHQHMRLDDFQTPFGTELMYADGGFYQDENYEWNGTEEYDWLLESEASKAMYCERKCLNIQVIEPFRMMMLWGERGNAQMD